MRDELKAVADRWMEEVFQQGRTQAVDEIHSSDFVDHSPAGRSADREGFKAGVAGLFAAFPDFRAITEDLVIDETAVKITVRWTATGTHRGEFMGIQPTDRRITFRGIEILRIAGDRIAERWGEWDGLDIVEQLGAKIA